MPSSPLPSKVLAQQIMHSLAQHGTPLSHGVSYYNVGNESILSALETHYLTSYLPEGGGVFKLLVGDYGSGKSHFLYCLRERAWAHRFPVSQVDLSPRECPYDDQKKVYAAVARALMWRDPDDASAEPVRGLANFLQRLLHDLVTRHGVELGSDEARTLPEVQALLSSLQHTHIDNTSYRYAISHMLEAILRGDAVQQELLGLWLHGEEINTVAMSELRQLNVTQKITRSNAFQMLRSLSQTVRALGFNGMCLLFDEMDRQMSLSRRAKAVISDNLREVIDRTREDLPGTLFVYAVLPLFVNEFVPQYDALWQRLQIRVGRYFSHTNPFSPQINLEQLDLDEQTLLVKIAERLQPIFEIAYEARLDTALQARNADRLAAAARRTRTATNHRRIFISSLAREWYRQWQEGQVELSDTDAYELVTHSSQDLNSDDY
ncbi:MAG: BREX system ATP-binding domain-containing protein [Aggregatilineales bacterium]